MLSLCFVIMRPSSLGGGRILRRTLSVCLSVRPVNIDRTSGHRSRVFVNLADVWYLLFCLHVRATYSTAISAAQACFVQFMFTAVRVVFEAEASGGVRQVVSPTLHFPLSLSPLSIPLSFQTNQWEGRSDPVRGSSPASPYKYHPDCS